MKKVYGEKKIHIFRRSWDMSPAPLDKKNPYHPLNIEIYKNIPKDKIPDSESLKDTYERVIPYFKKNISDKLNKNIIIAAHGNSIRALCKYLFNIDNEILRKYCLEQEQNTKGVVKSNIGGYQSPDFPLDAPELEELIQAIEWSFREYTADLIYPPPLSVANMWCNINYYKDGNAPHVHPNSVYSGAYYVQTPKDCGEICFQHPALDLLYHYQTEELEGVAWYPVLVVRRDFSQEHAKTLLNLIFAQSKGLNPNVLFQSLLRTNNTAFKKIYDYHAAAKKMLRFK